MASGIRDLRATIERLGGIVEEFYPLSELTTVKIGGRASLFTKVRDEKTLKNLLPRLGKRGIEYFILGNGSNVLFSDNTFPGLVIKLGEGFSDIKTIGQRSDSIVQVEVGAGTRLGKLVHDCAVKGLTGVEFLWGIPGTVGGALITNAGAFGFRFSDIVEKVRIVSNDGELKELPKDDIQFGYRECSINPPFYSPLYQKRINGVVVAIVLKLRRGDRELSQKKIGEFSRYRHKTQPTGLSFGCCFKNPPGISAGELIERAGLKGLRVGGAYVSKKHANFFLNDGSAKFADFYQLIELVKFYVEKRSGVVLEEEVRIVY